MAATVREKFWLKFVFAIAIASVWAIAFYLAASLVYPINSISAALVESWLHSGFSSAWNSSYYPPLWPIVGILFAKLGLVDVLSIQIAVAVILLFLSFLAFYRYGITAFFVGFAAFVFSPAFLYGALSFWRETAEIFVLLAIAGITVCAEKKKGNPYFLGAAFGALVGLGMLAKWTFWVYTLAFGLLILLAINPSLRLRFLIVAALTFFVVAFPWYFSKLDYKTFFETTKNDPSFCCPTYLSRLFWYCKELFNVCGYFYIALLVGAAVSAIRRPRILLFIFGIILPLVVLSMPVHIEIRYQAPLALLVAAGFAYAVDAAGFSKFTKWFLLAVFAASAFLQVNRLDKTVGSFASEEFLDMKKFFISSCPALNERASVKGKVAFNPVFPIHFGKAVELECGSENLKVYSPELFDRFKKEFLGGEYAIVINVMPQDADATDLEQIKKFSYAAQGLVIASTGEALSALKEKEIRDLFERLNRDYHLLFDDQSRSSRIEIWEQKSKD